MDSIVFLDDSEFECEAVRTQIQSVKTLQVPKNIFDYPEFFNRIKQFFVVNNQSKNIFLNHMSPDKTEQYRIRSLSLNEEAKFNNQDDFLYSLQLKIFLKKNHAPSISRISELTQKSNQFNLTTKRYNTAEILSFMENESSDVYSFEVSDKFGPSGLTGVVILRYENNITFIDSFLMSCRIIGRNLEFAIWDYIFKDVSKNEIKKICCEYIKTAKNQIVENFYDELGFEVVSNTQEKKCYIGYTDAFHITKKFFVEVIFYE